MPYCENCKNEIDRENIIVRTEILCMVDGHKEIETYWECPLCGSDDVIEEKPQEEDKE